MMVLVVHELLVNYKVALFVFAQHQLWAILAKRTKIEVEIKNADLLHQPVVFFPYLPLVNDGKPVIARESMNVGVVHKLVEELGKTKPYAVAVRIWTPAQPTQSRWGDGAGSVDISLGLPERAHAHEIL